MMKVQQFVNIFGKGIIGEIPLSPENRFIEIQMFMFREKGQLWVHLCQENRAGDRVDETAVGLGFDDKDRIRPIIVLKSFLGELFEHLKEKI
jgi:hypothetical protein